MEEPVEEPGERPVEEPVEEPGEEQVDEPTDDQVDEQTNEPVDEQDAIAFERVRRICLGLPGTEEAELQDRPLYRVGRRRFAIFNGASAPPRRRWDASGRSLHFLADPAEADALRQDERFVPSPHHGDRGWLAIRLDGNTDWDEIAELLESAHREVAPRRRPPE